MRVVITPDCDLVVRKGKPKVAGVLTMGGILRRFEEKGASADNFIVIKGRSYSVSWNPKDIATFPVEGPGSLRVKDGFEFVGTLRPLYAQAMQRRALVDLWRVGVPVAPALGVMGDVSVWIRLKRGGGEDFEKVVVDTPTGAVLIPGREGREGQRGGSLILLGRRFVWKLVDQLREMAVNRREEFDEGDLVALEKVLTKESVFCTRILTAGGPTDTVDGKFGVSFALGEEPRRKKDAAWLQVVLSVPAQELYES